MTTGEKLEAIRCALGCARMSVVNIHGAEVAYDEKRKRFVIEDETHEAYFDDYLDALAFAEKLSGKSRDIT